MTAARQSGRLRPFAVALGDSTSDLLRLRVHLLLDYASKPPSPPTRRSLWVGMGAAALVLLLPHLIGAWPLEIAHLAIELALSDLGLI